MSNSIPILFTIPNFITAGSGGAVLKVIERLDRTRFAPAVCVLRKGGRLDHEVERMGIPFLEAQFTVPARPLATLPFRAWRAAQVFRPYRFGLWHSSHYLDDYTEPLIARFAGARAWVYTKKNMNWHRWSWHLRTLFATHVAAQNRDMLSQFFAGPIYRAKSSLLPRGVDIDRFNPDTPARLQLREQFDPRKEMVLTGCVAHLLPVKGHMTLLHAVQQIPNLLLFLAGSPLDASYAHSLRETISRLQIDKRVQLMGNVADIPAFLGEMDIFVLPTWAKWRMEGCPVALLEAMACGRPCIATDIPGSRDLIEHGRSGVLVPPEDVDALASALKQLAVSAELRCNLGRAARRAVERDFSIDLEAAAHESLYQQLLARR